MSARARLAISWRRCLCSRRAASSIWVADRATPRSFWSSGSPLRTSSGSTPRLICCGKRARLPRCTFIESDLAIWMPETGADLLFGNAVFHWVPDHPGVMARLLTSLAEGGVLAVQMPDNTNEPALALMEETAKSGPWAAALARANAARNDLPSAEAYYDLLRPLCRHIDIWHTHYHHILANHAGVVEWFKGSGLRPFLAPLDATMRGAFTARYSQEISRAYPARSDGRVMLRFPRLFIVAVR
jgi:trans-aconitate 2-methyltransferase